MGRSVSTPSEARVVCYRDVSEFDSFDWSDFIEDLRETCKSQWKPFADCDEWIGGEDHALVENELCYVGISEYCGLAAIWISSKCEECRDSDYGPQPNANLCDSYIDKIAPKFCEFFGELNKIGTGSNGEAFFEKAS